MLPHGFMQDASTFEADLTEASQTSGHSLGYLHELHARRILHLFVPFRNVEDLKLNGSFVQKLQSIKLPPEACSVLQNVQDVMNSLNLRKEDDPLEKCTLCPRVVSDEDEEEEPTEDEVDTFTTLLQTFGGEQEGQAFSENAMFTKNILTETGVMRNQNHQNLKGMNVKKKDSLLSFTPDRSAADNSGEEHFINAREKVNQLRLTTLAAKSILEGSSSLKQARKNQQIKATGSPESIVHFGKSRSLDKKQQRAFEVLAGTFVLSFCEDAAMSPPPRGQNKKPSKRQRRERHDFLDCRSNLEKVCGRKGQLVMFLTGHGGAGKSHVLNAVLDCAKQFCLNLGVLFDRRTIVVTAITGVAAVSIQGETMHGAVRLGKEVKTEHINQWKNARLIIIDEVSFLKMSDLNEAHTNLCQLMESSPSKPFGGLNVVFCGDFRQLEPPKGVPLFKLRECTLWHDTVNCFIELHGMHRFKDDPVWGELLCRFRLGCPTEQDFEVINSRVAKGNVELPKNVQHATFTNKDRCEINDAVFAQHLKKTHSKSRTDKIPKHTVVILSDEMEWASKGKKGTPVAPGARREIHTNCSDCDVKTPGTRGHFVDLCLKLIIDCPMMLTENEDVSIGIANGTVCILRKVVLKRGLRESDIKIGKIDGCCVRMVNASQVDHLVCEFDVGGAFIGTFKVFAKNTTVNVDLKTNMMGMDHTFRFPISTNQFHVLVNHATTGHKLQGRSVDNLFVSSWTHTSNWPCVVLSRVRKLKGLFLRKPLDKTKDCRVDERLVAMLKKFERLEPDDFDLDDIA